MAQPYPRPPTLRIGTHNQDMSSTQIGVSPLKHASLCVSALKVQDYRAICSPRADLIAGCGGKKTEIYIQKNVPLLKKNPVQIWVLPK